MAPIAKSMEHYRGGNTVSKKRSDFEIIDQIEKVRAKNNVNWMDILRLGFTHAPDEARKLIGKVNESDMEISKLLKELSQNTEG